MEYRLWNDDDYVWFKETYNNVNDARKSAYRRRCLEIWLCSRNERSATKKFYVLGKVLNKNHNKYGVPIYISFAGKGDGKYILNPDGTLGRKLD